MFTAGKTGWRINAGSRPPLPPILRLPQALRKQAELPVDQPGGGFMRSRAAVSLASSLAITTSAGIQSPAWMDRAMASLPRCTKSPRALLWVRSFAGGVAWVMVSMVLR